MSFYEQGLKFTCQGCSFCCGGGEPGYVFLSEQDVKDISSFLKLSQADFISFYTRPVIKNGKTTLSLKEKSNYNCAFLNNGKCSIYPVRPLQCSTYPFWEGIMDAEANWEDEKQYCPGIGKGDLHTKEEIEQTLLKMKKRKLIEL